LTQACQVSAELDVERLIESQGPLQGFLVRGVCRFAQHHFHGIAGNEMQQKEDEADDPEHDGESRQDS
jgi:hypothetical protein